MIDVSVHVDSAILGYAASLGGLEITVDAIFSAPSATTTLFTTISRADLPTFESALEHDVTVATSERVRWSAERVRHAIRYSETGMRLSVFPQLVTAFGVFETARVDAAGWRVRLAFPSSERLQQFIRDCRTRGVVVSLETIARADEPAHECPFGLSEKQYELVRYAHEHGYYEVPRRTTLGEVADAFGISSQAASARLRRGIDALLANTLDDGGDD